MDNPEYFGWTIDKTKKGFTNEHSEKISVAKQYYNIAYKGQDDLYIYKHINQASNDISTGIFADISKNYLSIKNHLYTIYNYSNIKVEEYINYGKGATAYNGLDLTTYMLKAMKFLLEKDSSYTNQSEIKKYFKRIYNNTSKNNALFLKILYNDKLNNELPNDINEIKNFVLGTTITTDNGQIFLDNIVTKSIQIDIVSVINKNFINILDVLIQQLTNDALNNFSPNQKIKEKDLLLQIVPLLFQYGARNIANKKNITDIIVPKMKQIIDQFDNVDEHKNMLKITTEFYKNIINFWNDNFTQNDLAILIAGLVNSNINLIKDESSSNFDYDLKANILSEIIKNNSNLFKKYIYDGDSLEELLNTIDEDKRSVFTDITGIYALASSSGIENGLFLPDNVNLNSLDPEIVINDEEVSDPTWRGGTLENPNSYFQYDENGNIMYEDVNHNGELDANDKFLYNNNCVNYAVYYEMKQIKKSIATRVFNIELVGSDKNDNLDYNTIIKNNRDVDYVYDTKNGVFEVHFYIPENHDILQKDKIYINMNAGHYELSNGAIFKQKDVVIEVKDIDKNYIIFTILAEDRTVSQDYKLFIHITPASSLIFDNVEVDGISSEVVKHLQVNNIYAAVDVKVSNLVNGYDGIISLNYITNNMANGLNFMDKINIYRVNADNINEINFNLNYMDCIDFNNKLNENIDYQMPETRKNGIVYIPSAKDNETGYNDTSNSYDHGNLLIDIYLNNHLSKGVFAIEVVVNNNLKYYTFFEKEASHEAYIEEIVYNGQQFIPTIVDDNDNITILPNNENDKSLHQFGKAMTEEDFKLQKNIVNEQNNLQYNIPKYLDKFIISPLAKFEIVNVTAYKEGVKTVYKVDYIITAEDGNKTTSFSHYITEEDIDISISKVFIDGSVSEVNPNHKNETNYIYASQFKKQKNPAYRFEYNLSNFYNNDGNHYSVEICDSNGNPINDNDILKEIKDSIIINITNNYDFEIIFSDMAIAQDYYFRLVYNNSCKFNDIVGILNWNVNFDVVKLTKLKNENSYFDNIVFNSDTVIASTRTMISNEVITEKIYEEMLNSTNRKIVCLPGKIHYNEFAYDKNKQANFYVIGLVNKTMLDYYSPTFYIPDGPRVFRSTSYDDEIYNYIPYIDSKNQETTFLVNESGTKFKNEQGQDITVFGDIKQFTYNDNTYSISPVAGYPSIEINGEIIENQSLFTNYSEEGCYNKDTDSFGFIKYRVYAEIYGSLPDDKKSTAVTTYNIATQDITNNIRFNIAIQKDENCNINEITNSIYFELWCYKLIENGVENKDNRNDQYSFYNEIGLFAYYKMVNETEVSNELTHNLLQSNIAGWYDIKLYLPKGYTFSYVVINKGVSKDYKAGEEFYIEPSIFSITYDIIITIKSTDINDKWGVTEETNTMDK